VEGYGIYEDGVMINWFSSHKEARDYISLCSSRYQMRPTTVAVLNDVVPKASEDTIVVPKLLTRNEWLRLNPLNMHMRGNSMGYTGVSVATGGAIKPCRLQRMVIGFEEPTVREYELLAVAMESTYIGTQLEWHEWFERMPDTAFEGGI
jgi:hypothetical protein